jgi:hypothetical protein
MKALLLCLILLTAVASAIEVRLSVKLILTPGGTRPGTDCTEFDPCSNLATRANFQREVDLANRILAAAARGYSLRLVEYVEIRPSPPAGEAFNYWLQLDARGNRKTIEDAALANKTVWAWHDSAINIFVNNTSSGQCSFPGNGQSIALGRAVGQGTVLHEIGHFMGLRHTHAGDNSDCSAHTPPFSQYVADGDELGETVPDRQCFSRDQLSQATFNGRLFSALTAAEQDRVNSSWLNVMSYHQEERLLTGQMDIWSDNASLERRSVCDGRTIFVDRGSICFAALPPAYESYRWWVDQTPLPEPEWGVSKPAEITRDPPFPPEPPGYPANLAWPPLDGAPKPPGYPVNWPWPPVDLPAVTFCLGGPRKTLADGLAQAADGDVVMLRTGVYQEARRLTRRMKIGATRGTVTIR